MSSAYNVTKRALLQDYAGLTRKYLHERKLSDELLKLVCGLEGWRDCRTLNDNGEMLKPFAPTRFRKRLTDIDPLLFDFSWNHLDQTHYLHWSVYHIFTEWLLPPDEKGFGAMNVGIQEVPASGGPMHHGVLDVVFATWDDPRRYCGFPIETGSALLMRFWNYDHDRDCFTLRSEGAVAALLLQWSEPADGGIELLTTPLTSDRALQQDGIVFVDGDMGEFMPHENEEINSWSMAIRHLGQRRNFDPAGYVPVWRMAPNSAPPTSRVFDRFAIGLVSSEDQATMPAAALQHAYDALWQRYLGVKMLTDFTLRYSVRKPSELQTSLVRLYEDFSIVEP